MADTLNKGPIERLAYRLSSRRVRDCYDSLLGTDVWKVKGNGIHRIKPYPMGFYDDDPNLYWAIGWGCHDWMMPHERWLVRRVALRAQAQEVK